MRLDLPLCSENVDLINETRSALSPQTPPQCWLPLRILAHAPPLLKRLLCRWTLPGEMLLVSAHANWAQLHLLVDKLCLNWLPSLTLYQNKTANNSAVIFGTVRKLTITFALLSFKFLERKLETSHEWHRSLGNPLTFQFIEIMSTLEEWLSHFQRCGFSGEALCHLMRNESKFDKKFHENSIQFPRKKTKIKTDAIHRTSIRGDVTGAENKQYNTQSK